MFEQTFIAVACTYNKFLDPIIVINSREARLM